MKRSFPNSNLRLFLRGLVKSSDSIIFEPIGKIIEVVFSSVASNKEDEKSGSSSKESSHRHRDQTDNPWKDLIFQSIVLEIVGETICIGSETGIPNGCKDGSNQSLDSKQCEWVCIENAVLSSKLLLD